MKTEKEIKKDKKEVIEFCPNKETDINKCIWRGKTCFLCDWENQITPPSSSQ